jgi:hypothetical protein
MKRSAYRRASFVAFSILTLTVFLGCFCWPSLPSLIHRNGCASIQAAQPASPSGNGKAGVIPPPRMKLVYIHGGDVWIMDKDGKNKTRLTKTGESEFSLSFARNNERIWFIRSAGLSGSTPYGDVYSCDLKGKNISKITEGLKVRFAAVALDGKKMAISVITQFPDLSAGGQPADTSDMWIIDAEKTNQTESSSYINLTGDLPYAPEMGRDGSTFAAWSPTSTQLAFSYKGDSSASLGISSKAVYVADMDGGNRKEIIKSADEPAFDGQGQKIAAVTGGHWDTMGVVTVTTEGAALETVLAVAPGVTNPATLYSTFSPLWLNTYEDIAIQNNVFYSKTTHPAAPAEPVNSLERFDTDKKKTTVIVTMIGADKMIRRVSGSGYQEIMAFQVGSPDSPAGANASIWTVKPDGADLTQLTDGTGDTEPTWAADNSWWRGSSGATAKANKCHWPYANSTIQF